MKPYRKNMYTVAKRVAQSVINRVSEHKVLTRDWVLPGGSPIVVTLQTPAAVLAN